MEEEMNSADLETVMGKKELIRYELRRDIINKITVIRDRLPFLEERQLRRVLRKLNKVMKNAK
jgi:hypothetical protein